MYITQADRDSEWLLLGKVFVEVATDNASSLNLTTAQVTGLNNVYDAYENNLKNAEGQRSLAEAAVEQKNISRDQLEELIRRYAKQFRGMSTVSDALLAQMNLAPKSPVRTKSSPKQPLQLQAFPDTVGFVKLKWKGNGNTGVNYWVQWFNGQTNEWSTVTTSAGLKATLSGFPLGEEATFRVLAFKRGQQSIPSESVTIFAAQGEGFAELAA